MELTKALVWIFSIIVVLFAAMTLYPTMAMLAIVTLLCAVLILFQTFLILKAKE